MANKTDLAMDPMVAVRRPSRLSLVITLCLTVVLLALALRGLQWDEMLATAKRARVEYLLLACVVLTLANILRSFRWRILLQAEKPVAPVTGFWATMVGYLGNSFLPARAGEVIRSALLGNATGISKSYVFATALTERIMDVPALVLMGLLALGSLPSVAPWLTTAIQVMTWVGLGGVALLLMLPRLEWLVQRAIRWLPLPQRLQTTIGGLVEQFLLGMRALQHGGRASGFVLLTVAIWLCDAGIAMVVARSLDLSLALPQACLLLAALGLASAAPSTPGYVGIYQFVAVTVLPPFGFSPNEAIVYILTFQLVSYIVVTLWGSIGLWQLGGMGMLFKLRPLPRPVDASSSQR